MPAWPLMETRPGLATQLTNWVHGGRLTWGGDVSGIGKVVIYRRTDCCRGTGSGSLAVPIRLKQFHVDLLADNGDIVFTKYFPTAEPFGTGASLEIDFADKPEARFVLIRFDSDYTNYLSLAEVQVFAPTPTHTPVGKILAIAGSNLFTRDNLDSNWVQAANTGGHVTGITIMQDGKILGIGGGKLFTRNTLNSNWVQAANTGEHVTGITVMQDGKILGIGASKLFTRNTLNSNWVKAPDKGGSVIDIAIMQDGKILAIGNDKKLYTRDNLNSGWVQAPDKGGNVIGITIMQDGKILAIGNDKKLYTRDNLNSGWVKAPDQGGHVDAIAIMPV
jgi:uncharacterized protein YuzE